MLIRAQKTEAQLAKLGWYLGRVITPNAERTRACLKSAGYEDYYPKQRTMKATPKNRLSAAQRYSALPLYREVERPLWQGYLLLRFDIADGAWREMFREVGVVGILGNAELQSPLPFPAPAIAALKALEVKSAATGNHAIPATVTVRDIAAKLRDLVRLSKGDAGDAYVEPGLGYALGETVRIADGESFSGLEGKITELPDVPLAKLDESDRVKLLVAFFGGFVPVELPIGSIAKIPGGL